MYKTYHNSGGREFQRPGVSEHWGRGSATSTTSFFIRRICKRKRTSFNDNIIYEISNQYTNFDDRYSYYTE